MLNLIEFVYGYNGFYVTNWRFGSKQLRKKSEEARILFQRFGTIIQRKQPPLAEWCAMRKRQLNSDLAFELSPIIPSQKVDRYRNKCEWSVGE